MAKILTVATEVQKVVLEQVLFAEIATGFWKNARPADHADSWKGVSVDVGPELGPRGFDVPRNYNFVNPDFFSKMEDRLMEAAKTANPDITVKQLKKQLICLNQILGSRLVEVGGAVKKLSRGRKQATDATVVTSSKGTNKPTVRKVAVNFVEQPTTEQPA